MIYSSAHGIRAWLSIPVALFRFGTSSSWIRFVILLRSFSSRGGPLVFVPFFSLLSSRLGYSNNIFLLTSRSGISSGEIIFEDLSPFISIWFHLFQYVLVCRSFGVFVIRAVRSSLTSRSDISSVEVFFEDFSVFLDLFVDLVFVEIVDFLVLDLLHSCFDVVFGLVEVVLRSFFSDQSAMHLAQIFLGLVLLACFW